MTFLMAVMISPLLVEVLSFQATTSSPLDGQGQTPLASALTIREPVLFPTRFSPYSSPGYRDEVRMTFTPGVNVEANVSIYAYPQQVKAGSSGSHAKLCLVPVPEQGTLLLFSGGDLSDPYLRVARSTDNGTTWGPFEAIAEVDPMPSGNYMGEGSAVAAIHHQGTIHLLWGDAYWQLFYQSSPDLGVTWGPRQDLAAQVSPGAVHNIELAASPTGTLCVVYETTFGSEDHVFKAFNSTDEGTTWSTPNDLPEFSFPGSHVVKPSLAFTKEGDAMVGGVFDSTMLARVCIYSGGDLGASPAILYSGTEMSQGFTMTIDNGTGNILILSKNNDIIDAGFRLVNVTATSPWTMEILQDLPWNAPDYRRFTHVGLYATWIDCVDNRVFFLTSDPLRLTTPGSYFLNFTIGAPMLEYVRARFNAPAAQESRFTWNGTWNGQTIPYRSFMLAMTLQNVSVVPYSFYFVRDDEMPAINDLAYLPHISPGIPDGSKDRLIVNFSTSEYIKYRYLIENGQVETTPATTFLPDDHEKTNPAFLIDGKYNYYVIYPRKKGSMQQELVLCRSTDLGNTWSDPIVIFQASYTWECGATIHNGTLYVFAYLMAGEAVVLRSPDDGQHWETFSYTHATIGVPPSTMNKFSLAVSDDGRLYVGGGDRILVFNDGGESFSHEITFTGVDGQVSALAFDDPRQLLYVGFVDYWRAEDMTLNMTTWNTTTGAIHTTCNVFTGDRIHLLGISINASSGDATLVLLRHPMVNPTGSREYWTTTDFGVSWSTVSSEPASYGGAIGSSIAGTPTWFKDGISGVEVFGGSDQTAGSAMFLTVSSRLPFIASGTGFPQANLTGSITYDGRYSNGTVLNDGVYRFHLILVDQTYGRIETWIEFVVDNQRPTTCAVSSIPASPLPRNDVEVFFNASDAHLASVDLVYVYDDSGWITIPSQHVSGDRWTVGIPGNQSARRLRFAIRVEDLAGNVMFDTNNGFYYGWENPVVPDITPQWRLIVQEDDGDDFTTTNVLCFDLIFTEDVARFIDTLRVRYTLDGDAWAWTTLARFGTRFNGSIGPFPEGAFGTIEYQVICMDIVGNQQLVIEGEIFVAPALPDLVMTVAEGWLIFLLCVLLGFLLGYGLSVAIFPDQMSAYEHYVRSYNFTAELAGLTGRKGSTARLSDATSPYPALHDKRMLYNPVSKGFSRILRYQVTLLAGGITVMTGLLVAGLGDIAILLAGLNFLTSVFLFFSLLSYEIQQIGRGYVTFKKGLHQAVGAAITLYVALLSIFAVGYAVDWFRYYYLQVDMDVLGIPMPSMLFDLNLTYFTTIAVVLFVTFRSINGLKEKLIEKTQEGSNFQEIFMSREEELDGMGKDLVVEIAFFMFFVGYAFLLGVDLSKYAPLGITTGLGLLVGLVVAFTCLWVLGRKGREKLPKGFVSSVVYCSNCRKTTINGHFCDSCGQPLVATDQLVEDIIECPACNSQNKDGAVMCRICAAPLRPGPGGVATPPAAGAPVKDAPATTDKHAPGKKGKTELPAKEPAKPAAGSPSRSPKKPAT